MKDSLSRLERQRGSPADVILREMLAKNTGKGESNTEVNVGAQA
jgi:hypothetical protein